MKYEGSHTYEVSKRGLTVGTTFRENRVTVTENITQVVPVNPRRLSILVSNTTSNPVWFAFSPTYLAMGGFQVTGDGGTLILHVAEDGELVSSAIYARTRVGETTTLYVVEVYGLGE